MNRRQMEEMGVTGRRDQDGGWDWLRRPTELDQPVTTPVPDANGNYVSDDETGIETVPVVREERTLEFSGGPLMMAVKLPEGAVWLRQGQVQQPGFNGCCMEVGDVVRYADGREFKVWRVYDCVNLASVD